MTGPSRTPRGEHTPAPGTNWEAQLILHGEILIDRSGDTPRFASRDLDPPTPERYEPAPRRPNRATRRAMQRAARRNK
jgi:hypothetical protein